MRITIDEIRELEMVNRKTDNVFPITNNRLKIKEQGNVAALLLIVINGMSQPFSFFNSSMIAGTALKRSSTIP